MPNRAPFGPLFLFSSAVIHSIHAEMACFAKLELYNFLQRGSAPESEEKYGSTQHASIRFVGLHVLYALMGRVVRLNFQCMGASSMHSARMSSHLSHLVGRFGLSH